MFKHPFTNGNKRTALLSCGAFLYSIGLYLFFYKFNSKADYLSKWEDFMLYVANLKNDGKTEEQSIKIIKNHIRNYLLINFENNVLLYNREMLIS